MELLLPILRFFLGELELTFKLSSNLGGLGPEPLNYTSDNTKVFSHRNLLI